MGTRTHPSTASDVPWGTQTRGPGGFRAPRAAALPLLGHGLRGARGPWAWVGAPGVSDSFCGAKIPGSQPLLPPTSLSPFLQLLFQLSLGMASGAGHLGGDNSHQEVHLFENRVSNQISISEPSLQVAA